MYSNAQPPEGHPESSDVWLRSVYQDLRRIAASHLKQERRSHTLQPTALVNEAWMRMVRGSAITPIDRTDFLAIASSYMRRILIDHARKRAAGKREGVRLQVELTEGMGGSPRDPIDILFLDQLLERLRIMDVRACKIIEMNFFGGLTLDEIAGALSISSRTASRDWHVAKAWLHSELARARDL